ncbi:PilN domain-containing protein [Halobacillus rhizosphaerae]|uniref:PilN domain-containing protein n=1 Tax=Halobacillus rhizosphaerae TaxID=3064889 RepID=UPI00398AC121
MLMDINLLEEKEKPNRLPYFIIGIGLLALLFLAASTWYFDSRLSSEIDIHKEQLVNLTKRQSVLQDSLNNEELNQRMELQTAVKKEKNNILPPVRLLNDLISLLPDHGYFASYLFTSSQIELTVKFDSFRDAAAYTNHLSQKNYVTNVNLNNISTEPLSNSSLDPFKYRPKYSASYTVELTRELISEERNGK